MTCLISGEYPTLGSTVIRPAVSRSLIALAWFVASSGTPIFNGAFSWDPPAKSEIAIKEIRTIANVFS